MNEWQRWWMRRPRWTARRIVRAVHDTAIEYGLSEIYFAGMQFQNEIGVWISDCEVCSLEEAKAKCGPDIKLLRLPDSP
jgi:hypothetical protein